MVWTKDADTDRYGVEMPPPLALLGRVTGGEERGEVGPRMEPCITWQDDSTGVKCPLLPSTVNVMICCKYLWDVPSLCVDSGQLVGKRLWRSGQ